MQQLTGLNHDSQGMHDLNLRKRIFSLDQNEFPSLEDLNDAKTNGSTNSKHNSGVKSSSMVLSTIDSEVNEKLFENPKIFEEKEQDLYDYMTSKEKDITREQRASSSQNMMIDEPVILCHWKLNLPQFFQMAQKDESGDTGDWEYLSNPEGYELNDIQVNFMQKFYPEYAQKDPFSVMNWLFNKALKFQESQECTQISQYLDKLDYAFQESDEFDDEYSDEGEVNYNSFDEIMKRDNYEWSKFNFKKRPRRSVKADSPKQDQTLSDRRFSMKLKKKSSMQISKKQYKDLDIPYTQKATIFNAQNHLKVIFIGPSQTGKSTICGQIQNMMGQVKKIEMNKCQELAKSYQKDAFSNFCSQWPQYLMDVTEDERKSGCSQDIARVTIPNEDNIYTLLDCPGQETYQSKVISGAAIADIAVLVLSAKKCEEKCCTQDESYKSQILEQLKIVKGQGINQLIILVNKMETMKWARTKFDQLRQFVEPMLWELEFSIANTMFIPVSGLEGQNLVKPMSKTQQQKCDWYHGMSFLGALNHQTLIQASLDQFLNPEAIQSEDTVLMEVFDKLEFDSKNQGVHPGLHIQCLVKKGSTHSGQKLTLLPHNLPAQVINIQNQDFKNTDEAKAGELITVKLNVQDHSSVQVGDYLTQRELPKSILVSKELKVNIHFLETPHQRFISDGYKCILHKGSFNQEVILENIKKNGAHFVRVPTKTTCNIVSEQPTVIEKQEQFFLRDSYTDETIAIGSIMKYKAYELPIYDSLGGLIDIEDIKQQARDDYQRSDLKKKVLSQAMSVKEMLRKQERKAYEDSTLRKNLLATLGKVKDMQIDQGSSVKESLIIISKYKKEKRQIQGQA